MFGLFPKGPALGSAMIKAITKSYLSSVFLVPNWFISSCALAPSHEAYKETKEKKPAVLYCTVGACYPALDKLSRDDR